MNNSGYFAVVLFAFAWPATSSLQAAEYGPRQEARQMDTNADGIVSSGEHDAGVEAKFKAMDKDEDGFVTVDELDDARLDSGDTDKSPSAERIAMMDIDKDGKLSETEHENSERDKFKDADTSKDGNLSPEETKAAAAAMDDN